MGGGGGGPTLRALVERAVSQVPAGRVTTYGDVARALGDVRAARAVAQVLQGAEAARALPSHRVVQADGAVGSYPLGGPQAKAKRLSGEGVGVRDGRVVGLAACAVTAFDVEPLFAKLAARQVKLAARVETGALHRPPKVAVGVDAAYARDDARAFAAAVAVDLNTKEPFASAAVEFAPPVPYVPGYLAFRELPGIAAAIAKLPAEARRRAVLFADGQGILHPRRCGLASMAGVELDLPAVGAAKRKLVGRVLGGARTFGAFEGRRVVLGGEVRGFELRPKGGGPRPLYISPGTGLDALEAARLTASLTAPGDESPLPVLLADALSREARAAAG